MSKIKIKTLLVDNINNIDRTVDLLGEFMEQHIAKRTKELEKKNTELIKEISEQKQLEDTLFQSEKLRSIGTRISEVAHKFNNIFTIISGNAQLLENSYKDHGELADGLRTIKKATDEGAKISNRMFKIARIEKGGEGPYA
jgi:signal transduction histidine kinase